MAGARRRPGLSLGVVTIFVIAIVAALASGSTTKAPTPTSSPPGGSLVGSVGLPATATPAISTPSPSAAATSAGDSAALVGSPSDSDDASGSPSIAVDPTLLATLPEQVDGASLSEDADTERQDATDPNNAADLAALAVAIAVDTDTGDLAVASVVRVKPGVYSDAYFGDWRTTFDTGACSQAGGVSAKGTAVIAGRDAFTATCSGGLVTYHVHLADRGLIVSVSSLGQRQFGRLIVEGIR